jgi:hypothetical protein
MTPERATVINRCFNDRGLLIITGNWALFSTAPVLCDGPEAKVSEKLCQRDGLVVGVEAAGVGEDPGVAAAEWFLLEADARVFDTGDDAVGTDADEGDDGGAPAFNFGFKALAAGAKLIIGKFVGASGGAFDDVGDAEFKVEKERILKGREEARGEAAVMEGRPEAVSGAAEVTTDRGGVEAGVDASEENDEVFGDEIRDELVVRGKKLGFGGFPGGGQCPIHLSVSTSLSSRNERGNAGLDNGIEPDPQFDSVANFLHGVLRKGGDFKVLLDPAGGLRGG